MTAVLVSVQLAGSDVFTDFSTSSGSTGIDKLWFGAAETGPGASTRDFRNIKVGTTGYGSTDVFNPALSSTADFDSIVGSGITAASGVLSAVVASGDAYAVKDLGTEYTDLYVEFEFQRHSGDVSTGDFYDVVDSLNAIVDGFWPNGTQIHAAGLGWIISGGVPADDTWLKIGLHYVFDTSAVPLTATPSTFTFTAAGSDTSALTTDAAGWTDTGGTIDLAVTGAPFGVTLTLDDATINAGDGTTLTIRVNGGAVSGTYTLVLTGTGSGADTHSIDIILVIAASGTAATFDTVSATAQFHTNLERVALNAAGWDAADAGNSQTDVAANVSMCIHQGSIVVAHIDPNGDRWVDMWDGSAWVDLGIDTTVAGSASRPKLFSDGTSLWMSQVWVRLVLAGPPPQYSIGVAISKWDGSVWTKTLDNATVASASPRVLGQQGGDLVALAGVAYASFAADGVGWVFDDSGGSIALPSDAPFGAALVADGGQVLAIYTANATPPANTLAVIDYATDTVVTVTSEASVMGPEYPSGAPLNVRWGFGPASVAWNGTDYLADSAGVVFQISADGATVGPPEGVTEYAWGPAQFSGRIAWDDTAGKPWLIGDGTPASAVALQLACPGEHATPPKTWQRLLNGLEIGAFFYLPDDGFGINTSAVLAESVIVGDTIYTALLIQELDGNPGGDSDPFWNGHVQVWATTICRDCGTCPVIIGGGGIHAWERF